MVKITWGLTPGPSPATIWHAAFLLLALPGNCMPCSVPQVVSCASSFLLSPFTKDRYPGSVSPSADNSDIFSCRRSHSVPLLLAYFSIIASALMSPSPLTLLSYLSALLLCAQPSLSQTQSFLQSLWTLMFFAILWSHLRHLLSSQRLYLQVPNCNCLINFLRVKCNFLFPLRSPEPLQ